MVNPMLHGLSEWSAQEIDAACRVPYRRYLRSLDSHYKRYFARRPDLAGQHPQLAWGLKEALPTGWEHLAVELPPPARHRWHLSGKSSQVLALGILGVAKTRDPSLGWLWNTLRPSLPTDVANTPATLRFEYPLDADVLDERPRQTSVDVLVAADDRLLCIEAKLSEKGLGMCGCSGRAAGECSSRVLGRRLYWQAATEVLGLPARRSGWCPLSFTYQAVRNVAAAMALATPRQRPTFGLLYDARNPYFSGSDRWSGWVRQLDAALNRPDSPVDFVSTSWQDMVTGLPPDLDASVWAATKHQLAGWPAS